MIGIVLVASLTLLASFVCSLLEAALYSITPSEVEVLKQRGVRGARRLERLRADVETPIAAILTVNTIAHTVGAAWCGAMVAEEFGNRALGVFVTVFTILVLAATEIVPKSLGVRHARRLGTWIVWPLQVMIWSVWPVGWLARRSMRLLTGPGRKPGPSEEEVVLFARLAAQRGSMRGEEQRWVENALRLDRVKAGELRTPRTVVQTLSAEATVGDVAKRHEELAHSRIPITDGSNADRVTGLVLRREVLDAAIAGRTELRLRELMHPIHFVPETMPAHELLGLFLRRRKHLVAVVDEYGGFEGVVTLEDVIESLLGEEIVDEHDEAEDMQELAQQRNRFEFDSEPARDPERARRDADRGEDQTEQSDAPRG